MKIKKLIILSLISLGFILSIIYIIQKITHKDNVVINPELNMKIEANLNKDFGSSSMNELAIALITKNGIIWQKHLNKNEKSDGNQFSIASLTKPFTAAARCNL